MNAANTGKSPNDGLSAQALVAMIDRAGAVAPSPEPVLPHVADPLCQKE